MQASALDRVRRDLRRTLLLTSLFGIFSNLLVLAPALYTMQVFSKVISSGSLETLLMLTVIAVGALLALALLDLVRGRIIARLGVVIEATLFEPVVARVVDRSKAGPAIGSQPLRDLAHLRRYLSGSQVLALIDAPWAPIFIFVLYLMHPWFGLLAMVTAVVMIVIAVINEALARAPSREAHSSAVSVLQQVDSATRRTANLSAFGVSANLVPQWFRRTTDAGRHHLSLSDRNGLLLALTKFIRLTAQVLTLGIGALLTLRGETTPGVMIAASIILGRGLAPAEQSIGTWSAFVGVREAWRRITALLAGPEAPPRTAVLPETAPEVRLENIWFAPDRAADPLLRAVSTRFAAGEVTGIVGPPGAGKSLVCQCIADALTPSAGRVMVGDVDLRAVTPASKLRGIGYLPQKAEILDGTIAENIARFDPEVGQDRIAEAARRVGAESYIRTLPNGYETRVGAGGHALSASQEQMIGLARAIVTRPPVLVLDDPLAHLGRSRFQDFLTLLRDMKGAGVTVIVAQPPDGMMTLVDTLVVMRDGLVEVAGPRNRILETLQQRPGGA